MADIRIKDLATTASTTASDDFLAVDGTTNGTRKLSAATPSFATSVTVPGVAGPTATDLTLTGGSTGASLVLGQGASGAVTITPKGTTGQFFVNKSGAASATFVTELYGANGSNLVGIGADGSNGKIGAYSSAYSSVALEVQPAGGNVLIGGNANIPGSGGLKVYGTTAASSTTTGALQVGSNVGLSGNAGGASYFGGSITSVNAAASLQFNIDSIASGTAGGASFNLRNAGGNILSLGNQSNIIGGAYSAVPMLFFTGASMRFYSNTAAADAFTLSSTGAATFAGAVTVGGNITLPAASAATTRYIISASNNDGTVVFQNGVGSAVAGGSLQLSGLTHATRPGWVTVGLGSGSTRKFTVSDIGLPGGNDVFTVDQLGKTTISDSTASTGVGTGALQVAGGIYAGAASVFGGAVTMPSAIVKRASTAADGFTIYFTGGTQYWEIGLQAVGTSNDFRIVNSQSGNRSLSISSSTEAATFAGLIFPQQAATAPTYVKGAIYFDTTLNKLRVGGATGWETITSV